MIEEKSPAKINLSLRVVGKRKDGYHELETLMHELDLHDRLYLGATGKDTFSCDNKNVPTDRANLIWRAVDLFRKHSGIKEGVRIRLEKKIPLGGGLGGGSSNAIVVLQHLFIKHRLLEKEGGFKLLEEMSAELGSDTNFFLFGGTALCRGRGEKIETLEDRSYYFSLIFPEFGCDTAKVFAHYEKEDSKILDKEEPRVVNHLEPACRRAYPEIDRLFNMVRAEDIEIFLTGSGSTLFTIHDTSPDRDSTYEKLKRILKTEKVVVSKTQSASH